MTTCCNSLLLFSVAPKIDRNALMDIKIRVGQSFEFNVPVIGEPPPSKDWEHKDNTVMNTDRIKIVNEDYLTKLKVTDAKRGDSGVYTLKAKNKNGSDSATVNVLVMDVPLPPEGPLKADNVTKNSMTLHWRPPKDDGGCEITHYAVEKLDTENMRWVPVGEALGTSLRVDHLQEGHDYNFRVRAVNKQGESAPLTTMDSITAKDPFTKPDKPGAPQATDWDKDHVDLEWTPPKKDGGTPITGYIIEKRKKHGYVVIIIYKLISCSFVITCRHYISTSHFAIKCLITFCHKISSFSFFIKFLHSISSLNFFIKFLRLTYVNS